MDGEKYYRGSMGDWYQYLPICRRVLDPSSGLVLSEYILYSVYNCSFYADTIFKSAFTPEQQRLIQNPPSERGEEKLFLLSVADVTNPEYGFSSDRDWKALIRDLYSGGRSVSMDDADPVWGEWWLCEYSYVDTPGRITKEYFSDRGGFPHGVRPAMYLDPGAYIITSDVKSVGKYTELSFTQKIAAFVERIADFFRRLFGISTNAVESYLGIVNVD